MALDPEKEFEGLHRTHDTDDPKFISFVKKTIKSKTIKINAYMISTLEDCKMLKLNVEKYIKGISQGARTIKGYLSEEACTELVKLLDAIPKKTVQDARTKEDVEVPIKIEKEKSDVGKVLDLDNLFD